MKKEKMGQLILLLTALMWGSGYLFVDVALKSIEPFNIMAIRFLIASLIIYILKAKTLNKTIKDNLFGGSIIGLFLFIAFAFQTVGLEYTTPSKNAFLTAVNILFVPIILVVFFKNKWELKQIIGAILMIVGIGTLSLGQATDLNYGDFLTIIGAFFFALHIVAITRYITSKNLIALVFLQLFVAALISLFVSIIFEDFTLVVPKEATVSILYLGFISSALTFFLQNYGMQYVKANTGAIILSLESLFGAVLSVVFGFEELTMAMIVGFIIITGAILVIEVEIKKKKSLS